MGSLNSSTHCCGTQTLVYLSVSQTEKHHTHTPLNLFHKPSTQFNRSVQTGIIQMAEGNCNKIRGRFLDTLQGPYISALRITRLDCAI